MKLHASGEDYLEAILVLHKKMGMVRSVDVARHLEVTKPSVCHAVATLRDGGLSYNGRRSRFPSDRCPRGFTSAIAESEFSPQALTQNCPACRIEHIISDESISRLKVAAQEQE